MSHTLLIHPIGQLIALVCGFINIFTGFFKKNINLALHLNCGVIYYFATFLGSCVGFFLSGWASDNNIIIEMVFHKWNSVIIIFLFASGAATGFSMLMDNKKKAHLKKIHGLINLTSIVLFMIQFFSGIIQLLRLF